MQLTNTEYEELQRKVSNANKRVKSTKDEMEAVVMKGVGALEAGGASFGLGVINGRYGNPEVLGVPVDVATAMLAGTLSIAGIASEHTYLVMVGSACSFASGMGVGVGQRMARATATAAAAAAAVNAPPAP